MGEKELCRSGVHILGLWGRVTAPGLELATNWIRGGNAIDYAKQTDDI